MLGTKAEVKARLNELLTQDARTKDEKREIFELQTQLSEFKKAAQNGVAEVTQTVDAEVAVLTDTPIEEAIAFPEPPEIDEVDDESYGFDDEEEEELV